MRQRHSCEQNPQHSDSQIGVIAQTGHLPRVSEGSSHTSGPHKTYPPIGMCIRMMSPHNFHFENQQHLILDSMRSLRNRKSALKWSGYSITHSKTQPETAIWKKPEENLLANFRSCVTPSRATPAQGSRKPATLKATSVQKCAHSYHCWSLPPVWLRVSSTHQCTCSSHDLVMTG